MTERLTHIHQLAECGYVEMHLVEHWMWSNLLLNKQMHYFPQFGYLRTSLNIEKKMNSEFLNVLHGNFPSFNMTNDSIAFDLQFFCSSYILGPIQFVF